MTDKQTTKAIKYISEAAEYQPSSTGEQHYSIDATVTTTNIEVVKSFYSTDFQQHVDEIGTYCTANSIELILVDTEAIMTEYEDINVNLFIEDVYKIGLSVVFANKRPDSDGVLFTS